MKHNWVICDSIYSQEDCAEIIELCINNTNKNIYDGPANDVKKTSEVNLTNYRHLKEKLKEAHEFVKHINKTFFGFDLFETCDGDVLLLNVYDGDKKSEYGWHTDGTKEHEVYDFKLTVLLNLSQEYYAGGELKIFANGGEQVLDAFAKPGAICVFPSYIPHKVSNVTFGKRISLTQFYLGPKFR